MIVNTGKLLEYVHIFTFAHLPYMYVCMCGVLNMLSAHNVVRLRAFAKAVELRSTTKCHIDTRLRVCQQRGNGADGGRVDDNSGVNVAANSVMAIR